MFVCSEAENALAGQTVAKFVKVTIDLHALIKSCPKPCHLRRFDECSCACSIFNFLVGHLL